MIMEVLYNKINIYIYIVCISLTHTCPKVLQ